eukprot:6641284-Prymnesium_polylepis.1
MLLCRSTSTNLVTAMLSIGSVRCGAKGRFVNTKEQATTSNAPEEPTSSKVDEEIDISAFIYSP